MSIEHYENLPMESKWIRYGDIVTHDLLSGRHVVAEAIHDDLGWKIGLRKLGPNDKDDPIETPIIWFYQDKWKKGMKLICVETMTIVGKAVKRKHGDHVPFENIPRSELGECVSTPFTHADKFPEGHPLRDMPYWNHPGGKNLTNIACLEWLLTHMEFDEKNLSCPQNKKSLPLLQQVLDLQNERRRLRIEQRVLGTKLPHTTPGEENA